MKRIRQAQTLKNRVQPITAVQIGTIVQNDFDAANWSGDTAFCTFDPTGINIDFAGPAGFNQRIYYNKWVSNLENFKMEASVTLGLISNYGPSLSMIIPGATIQLEKSALMGTGGPNFGRLDIWSGGVYIGSAVATITMTAGDNINVTLEKVNDVLTVTMQNVATGSALITYSQTFPFTYPFTSFQTPFIFTFGFSAYGDGACRVTQFKFSSNDYKNTKACVISDSKGLYFAGSYGNIFTNLIRAAYPTKYFNLSGGVNETLNDVILKLDELILLNSKKYFIYAGCNDYRYGQSAQIAARLATIKAALEINGNVCYFVNSTIEAGTGGGIGAVGTAFVNAAGAAVFGANCIDTSSILLTDLEADGIHLKAATETLMKNLITPYL